ncbi:unnamed protein product, partial [Polarella glacialis]
ALLTAEELATTFSRLDLDGSKSLSKAEFGQGVFDLGHVSQKASEVWVDRVFKEFDLDHNGTLDMDEFSKYVVSHASSLRSSFDELDVSHTGLLSADDVRSSLTKAKVSFLDQDVEVLLRRLGLGSGEADISWHSFLEATLLLPDMSSRDLMLSQYNQLSLHAPPSATTPLMLVIAGFVAGGISRTATAPADRLRAILATGREASISSAISSTLRNEGWRGFWQGNLANCIQVGPESALTFYFYEALKDKFCHDVHAPTASERFLAGSASGALSMTAVYPMYVIQNRLAAAPSGTYRSLLDCVRQTAAGGVPSLFAGYLPSLVRIIPYKGIDLAGYNILKDKLKDPNTAEISQLHSLACGGAASMCSQSLTYPLMLARTVLQQPVDVAGGGRSYSGMLEVLVHRRQLHGLSGWYAGLAPQLCKMVPAVAIQFAIYERTLHFVADLWKR